MPVMGDVVRIVLVEDVAADAALVERELRQAGLAFEATRVETAEELLAALDSVRPDLVISDYSLPGFDGMRALELVQRRVPETPFIMVTGSLNEEVAVECMKAGAADYVLKDRLVRLPAAVLGALEKARLKREQAAAAHALAESEARYRSLFEQAPIGIYRTTPDGRILAANPVLVEKLGFATFAELVERDLEREGFASGESRESFKARIERDGEVIGLASRWRTRGGEELLVRENARAIRGADGAVRFYEGTVEDMTAQVRAEAALRESEQQYRTVFDEANDAIVIFEPESEVILDVNARACEAYGYARDELLGTSLKRLTKDVTHGERGIGKLMRDGTYRDFETVHVTRDGREINIVSNASVITYAGRIAVLSINRDVTARRRADAALRESEALNRGVLDSVLSHVAVLDRDGRVVTVNEAWRRFARENRTAGSARGLGTEVGTNYLEVCRRAAGPGAEGALEANDGIVAVLAGTSSSYIAEYACHAPGVLRWFQMSVTPLATSSGGAVVAHLDVTARRRTDERLRLLAAAVEQAAETVVITDTAGAILYVNPAFERVTGFTRAESLGRKPSLQKSGQHTRAFYERLWATLERGESWTGHFVNRRKDGTQYEEDATISPVRDEDGSITHYVAVKRDVTHELALREQLEHAQKMEAIGRLAGGVAHDFNNVLQAMLSHVHLLRALVEAERPRRSIDELAELVRRSATLTRQLLLFSRRETSRMERVDLGEAVRGAVGLLRRLVRANVHFEEQLEAGPLPVTADRGQLDQVLMNLVVNASDAMPGGGRLVVSTSEEQGRAVLHVADNGAGVHESLRSRIFEPFFTTKPSGSGTGLGLSVVHGIVAQHGWTIEVTDTEGGGATFTVRLPLAESGEYESLGEPTESIEVPAGRGERVLVVEDEEGARVALVEILSALGYEVVGVGSGEEARLLPAEPRFALVLSDLILPGVAGPDLVRGLEVRWPGLRVILMSGYTEDEAVRRDVRRGQVRFLQKPFDSATLARELRAALDAPPGSR